MKLPWYSWLLVGIFVTITSSVLDIGIFLWVGLLFILVGVVKAAIIIMLKPEEPKQVHQSQPTPSVYLCPRCKASINSRDAFCRLCGMKLR